MRRYDPFSAIKHFTEELPLPEDEKERIIRSARFEEVPVKLIDPPPFADRRKLEGIEELARSIEKVGLIHPIVVRKKGKRYERLAGRRRLEAVKMLGWEKVPALVVEVSDETATGILLAENAFRKDLTEVERIEAQVRYLAHVLGMKEETLLKRLKSIASAKKSGKEIGEADEKLIERISSLLEHTSGISVRTFLEKVRILEAPEYVLDAAVKLGWGYRTVILLQMLISKGYEEEAKRIVERALRERLGYVRVKELVDEVLGRKKQTKFNVFKTLAKKYEKLPDEKKKEVDRILKELERILEEA